MPERLLYIEDNPAQQMAWKMIFTHIGNYEVDLAGDGIEGLEKLDDIYSVIVLDMSLPKMNGLAFLDELHSNEAYENLRDIPIVVLTIWSDLEEVEKKCSQYRVKLISKEEEDEIVIKKMKSFIIERSKNDGQ